MRCEQDRTIPGGPHIQIVPMADFHVLPATALAPAALHTAFTAAFADYLIGPFQLTLAQFPQFTARQGVDAALCRVALQGETVLAFAFVAPRADRPSWRLATMGAVPAARGTGAAAALLDDFIARAREAGCAEVELECFAQNERALRLYRGRGFAPVHALYGYSREPADKPASAQVASGDAIPLDDAYAWLEEAGAAIGDLPLQVTPLSLRAQPAALQAWRSGSALAVAGESAPGVLTLYCLVDRDARQAGAEQLVAYLLARFPAHRIAVPQLQRDDLGGEALLRLGFQRLPLHQWWMRKPL
ncbi:MAG: GNAT family N-acetyltransferase [Haliea sp.]|nr:MAG: GNAT family N-acetyltransferase [Haliea sp.]